MSHGWVDYRAVKANVSMEMALATYGIHLHRLDRVISPWAVSATDPPIQDEPPEFHREH